MKIYVVKRNSDTIEGRGPMVTHSVWHNLDNAKLFVQTKLGVMGSRFKEWTFHKGYEYTTKYFNPDYDDTTRSSDYWDGGNDWVIDIVETRD